MRLIIWILDARVDDALAILASVRFQQDMTWGKDGRTDDFGLPGTTTVVGDLPDDRIEELDLIDGIESWSTDLAADPMTDAAPGEFVESQDQLL